MSIYKITVLNFEEHNRTLKKGHKKTLIANNFCEDAKLAMLPINARYLFLKFILCCGDVHSKTFQISSEVMRMCLQNRFNIDSMLNAMQSLQLLTYEKSEPFRIEKKRIEKKRIEKNQTGSQKKPEPEQPELLAQAEPDAETVRRPKFDFESVYKTWPKKKGKSDGMIVLNRTINTQQQFEDFEKAVANAVESHRLAGTDHQYIPHWDTMIGPVKNPRWRDWLDWQPDPREGVRQRRLTNSELNAISLSEMYADATAEAEAERAKNENR